jgi:hypothetical protein
MERKWHERRKDLKVQKWIKGKKTGQKKTPVGTRVFIFYTPIQTGHRTHPASATMDTWALSGGKAAGDQHRGSYCIELYRHYPSELLWHITV